MMLADLNPAMTMMGVPGVAQHSYPNNHPVHSVASHMLDKTVGIIFV